MSKRIRGNIPTAINPNAYYRVDDISAVLNVSRAIIYRLKAEGKLPPWDNPFGLEKLAGYTGQTLLGITEQLFHGNTHENSSAKGEGSSKLDIPATTYRGRGRPRVTDSPKIN